MPMMLLVAPYDEPLSTEARTAKPPPVFPRVLFTPSQTNRRLVYVVANPVADCVVPLVVVSVARSVRLAVAAGAVLAHADPVLVRTLPAVLGAVLMTVPLVLGSVSVVSAAAAPASRVTEPPPEPLIDTGMSD